MAANDIAFSAWKKSNFVWVYWTDITWWWRWKFNVTKIYQLLMQSYKDTNNSAIWWYDICIHISFSKWKIFQEDKYSTSLGCWARECRYAKSRVASILRAGHCGTILFADIIFIPAPTTLLCNGYHSLQLSKLAFSKVHSKQKLRERWTACHDVTSKKQNG